MQFVLLLVPYKMASIFFVINLNSTNGDLILIKQVALHTM